MHLLMSSSDDTTELQRLIDRYLADETASDELIQYASRRLRALTRKMLARYPHVRRWEETDDVMQMAMIRLHRSLSEVRPESKKAFFGLAATQLRRTLIDLARHYYGAHGIGRNHKSAANSEFNELRGDPRLSSLDKPEELARWSEFHEAIDGLPEEDREIISLIWYGGLKQKEVAQLLQISERTVIRRLNRAKLALNEVLIDPPV